MTPKLRGRYSTLGSTEGEFEPGSGNRVLKNLLKITSKREMDIQEWEALQTATNKAVNSYHPSHQFKANDIISLHKTWLKKIYPWAGQYRQVNVSKGDFHFAAANQIEKLMHRLEEKILKKYTPCIFSDMTQITEAIAITHTELVLIHPFRDGNGRLSRLLATLMALQAGLPLLDFNGVQGKRKQAYFRAAQAGIEKDYEPMVKIFDSVIKRTLKSYR